MENQVLCVVIFLVVVLVEAQLSKPLTCSDPKRICTSYLHYLMPVNASYQDVETLFNVWVDDISVEAANTNYANDKSLFIKVKCSCTEDAVTGVWDYSYQLNSKLINADFQSYQGLVWNNTDTPNSIWLLCGCSSIEYPFLISYVVNDGDTLKLLTQRFNSNKTAIMNVNSIGNEEFIQNGVVYYIPVNSIPGPSIGPPPMQQPEGLHHHGQKISVGVIVAIAAAAAVVFSLILGFVIRGLKTAAAKKEDENLINGCFSCCGEERGTSQNPSLLHNYNNNTRTPPAISRELASGVAEIEKPLIFSYDEIVMATDNFKESHILGEGAYGCVYYGLLRDEEVAVKKMKATKTKEFLIELKVLCKVHHANLVELFGYSSSEDALFLVYEYAENKSLSDRLHEPLVKGYTPLTWIARIQIAVDAARGLEYIHDHTKAHYVHRDVKTSNILLDGNLRAKIADFGLAKLIEHADEGNASMTRIVGTFGYLAPEYLRDGHATAKSDVYAFGVVLFELITGKEAISKSKTFVPSTPERRSLISIMLGALRESNGGSDEQVKEVVDPIMENMYPSDALYRVARLGKQCVEEDPLARPDMKQVVFTLSQVLFNSIEWEATLAGNSQVFSRVIHGR